MLQLAVELLRLFADGTLPATAVQRLASSAWADGWGRHDALASRLRRAGAGGTHSGNVQRDIMTAARLAGLFEDVPDSYMFEIRGKGGVYRKAECMLPHEMLHKLVGDVGIEGFVIPEPELNADHGVGALVREWVQHTDVDVGLEAAASVVPIGTHADGVQYSSSIRAGGAKSVIGVSWNLLSGSAKQRARRFLFCALLKSDLCDCGCGGFHSFQDVFRVWSWSMGLSRGGKSPERRHDGKPWTAHDRKRRMPAGEQLPLAALLQLRGDWEWYCTCFRFRRARRK